MNTKIDKTTKLKKKHNIYAFIDSQNLNLGTSKDIYKGKNKIYTGWKLEFESKKVGGVAI